MHDGFRILARRQGDRIKLFTRNGYDFTSRFPKIAAAVAALPALSCVVDGEAIVVNRQGVARASSSKAGVLRCVARTRSAMKLMHYYDCARPLWDS